MQRRVKNRRRSAKRFLVNSGRRRWLGLLALILVPLGIVVLIYTVTEESPDGTGSGKKIVRERLQPENDVQAGIVQLKTELQRNPGDAGARRQLGELYLNAGDGASAEKELRAAIQLGAKSDELTPLVLRALLLQGRFQQVLDDLDKSDELVEPDSRTELVRGEALLGLERLQAAISSFDRATVLDPEDAEAFTKLAEVLILVRDLATAEQRIDQALALDATARRALLLKGELRRLRGSPEEGIRYFDRILLLQPDEPAAITARIAALIDLDQDERAKLEIERLKEQAGLNPMAAYFEAVILAREGNHRAAQSALVRVSAALGHSVTVQRFRATLHYALGEYEQARRLLGRLLKSEPSSISSQKLLAATLIKLEMPQEAIVVLERTKAEVPDDPVVRTLISNAYLSLKDFRAATESFERGLAATSPAIGASAAPFQASADHGASLPSFLRALEHLSSGRLEQVDSIARELAQLDPDSPLAGYLSASLDLAVGNLAQAVPAFERVASALPDFLPAQISLGDLYVRNGQLELAEAQSNKVLERWPERFEPLLLAADLAWRKERSEASYSFLEQAVSIAPGAIEPRSAMIRRHLDLGRVPDARDLARKVAKDFPSEPAAIALRAQIELRAGDPRQAIIYLRRLVASQPHDLRHRQLLADAHLSAGDRAAAKSQLSTIVEQGGQHPSTVLGLIDLELADGDLTAAKTFAERLPAAPEQAPRLYSALAELYRRYGHSEEAKSAYQDAWQHTQSREIALALYRIDRSNQTDAETALEPLKSWVASHPEDVAARHFLAFELMANGSARKAIDIYEGLRAIEPENPIILNNLAWLYHEIADPRAVQLAERALSSVPDEPAVMDTLGWILVDLGQLERAEELLQEAVSRAPNDAEVSFHYAVLLERSGRPEKARKILEHILSEPESFRSASAAQALLNKVTAE